MTPAAREIYMYCHGYYRVDPYYKKNGRLAKARQVAYFVFKHVYEEASLKQISGAFDKDCHTTIIHGIARVEADYELLKNAKHIVKLFQR